MAQLEHHALRQRTQVFFPALLLPIMYFMGGSGAQKGARD